MSLETLLFRSIRLSYRLFVALFCCFCVFVFCLHGVLGEIVELTVPCIRLHDFSPLIKTNKISQKDNPMNLIIVSITNVPYS